MKHCKLARESLDAESRAKLEVLIAEHDPMGRLLTWTRRARRVQTAAQATCRSVTNSGKRIASPRGNCSQKRPAGARRRFEPHASQKASQVNVARSRNQRHQPVPLIDLLQTLVARQYQTDDDVNRSRRK